MAWSMVYRGLLVCSIFLSCISCAPVISSEVRALIDPRLSYDQIAIHPELYVGKSVLLAGTIIEAKNLKQGTRLEILQYPATRRGYPRIDKPAGGRFLVLAPVYLETEIYRSGRAITVAGDISGVQTLPLGEAVYRYPTLISRELHLWDLRGRFPQLHFEFGVGFSKSF
jgi:outer membrane lipoprotein